MADLINIRPTRDSATSEEMDAAAKALGMSRNEMILKAVDIIRGFDVSFYRKLEQYSQRCKVPMSIAIQNTMVKMWAQDTARAKAWDGNSRVLDEFMQVGDETIGAKKLYERVYKETYDEATKERFEDLKEKLKSGRTLTEKEEAFYNDFKRIYGYVPKQKKEALEEGLAFWEGEDGFDKLIKGK
jgi:hypothetical protein